VALRARLPRSQTRRDALTATAAEQDALLDLFDELLALSVGERELRLATLDAQTAALLRAMLIADTQAERQLPQVPFASLAQRFEGLEPGQRLGSFELVRLVGHGGMGQVYLGQRIGEVQQQAAIKVQLPLIATEETLRRFRLERQMLAGLEHPAIARLIECGEDSQGRPYYAMEWVDGLTIDRYCDQHQLDLKARLRLFAQLCEGVDYAHRHLVVHRDIKASNIMVSHDGQPKLLDFGIAKALDGATAAMDSTATHARFFSPHHAAPEQVRGEAITIGCDVYALGVLLYQLLSGLRPYELEGLSPRAVEEQICELAPPAPSERLAALRDRDAPSAEQLSKTRGASRTAGLIHALQGDLDRIVLHALRKRPEERYASAAELCADVQRFLDGEAVLARGMGRAYRARKFVGRHRLATALAAGFVTALSAFAVVLWIQAGALRRERDEVAKQLHRAEIEQTRAEQVTAFIEQTFAHADPSFALGEKLTVSDVLNTGARTLDSAQFDDPELRHRMQLTLGRVMQSLGRYAESAKLVSEIDPRLAPAQRLAALSLQSESAASMEDLEQAKRLSDTALALLPANPMSVNVIARVDQGHAWLARGRVLRALDDKDAALEAAKRAIELLDPKVDNQYLAYSQALRLHARLLLEMGDSAASRAQSETLLQSQREHLPAHHPALLDTLGLLAYQYTKSGELDKAEALLSQQVESAEKVLGSESMQLAFALNGRGMLLAERGDPERSRADYQQALKIMLSRLGPENAYAPYVLYAIGELELLQGDLGQAEARYREAVAIVAKNSTPDAGDTAYFRLGLGSALSDAGRLHEALPEIEAGLAGLSVIKGMAYAMALAEKALWLARKGRVEESRKLWEEAQPILARELSPDNRSRQRLERSLGHLGSS
jgi:eukaryotic-like serine/threonine-protein kinase